MIEQKIGATSSNNELREIRKQQELLSQKEEEDFTFQWQQKLYSQVSFILNLFVVSLMLLNIKQ